MSAWCINEVILRSKNVLRVHSTKKNLQVKTMFKFMDCHEFARSRFANSRNDSDLVILRPCKKQVVSNQSPKFKPFATLKIQAPNSNSQTNSAQNSSSKFKPTNKLHTKSLSTQSDLSLFRSFISFMLSTIIPTTKLSTTKPTISTKLTNTTQA